jgi:hypothetical protein
VCCLRWYKLISVSAVDGTLLRIRYIKSSHSCEMMLEPPEIRIFSIATSCCNDWRTFLHTHVGVLSMASKERAGKPLCSPLITCSPESMGGE